MHAHLYREVFWKGNAPTHVQVGPSDISLETYRKEMQWILPGREIHGLHFPFPPWRVPFDVAASNAWVSQEIKKDSMARGQFLVRPTDEPDWVCQEVRRLGLRGLKPFSGLANVEQCSHAEIPEYLPEQLVSVANKESWTITLHLMRPRSVADPSNIYWIRTYCKKYPHMNLILDHSARGFNPYHTMIGLQKLSDLDNLWVDTSANCSPLATIAALRYLGPDRVMYGSDFYCSHIRGINFAVNDYFMWLDEDFFVSNNDTKTGQVCPTLIGLENLRAVKAAFWALGLKDKEIEKYFWQNAACLLDL